MKKYKFLICLMVLVSIILCVPSIKYLINNKTVDGFDAYYTFSLQKANNYAIGLINGIVVIGLLLVFSVLYFLIIKKEKIIFKSTKNILIFITIISLIFVIILPFLSSDIYYYIGDSWLAAKYKENPYYTSVNDLQNSGINDEILDNTGYWKETTSVYGPLWNSIAKLLVSFSFGNITIALFIFKIISMLIHMCNCYITYKLTNSRKYMLIYGLNPLILIEFLSNGHNDIYLLLFILLAIYYLIKKKNIYLTIICLALSVSIKYSTALLVPFVLIYCFKNKSIPKRILFCILSGLSIVGFVVLMYLPYYRDMSVFTNMLVQGSKYSQSVILYIMEEINISLGLNIAKIAIPIFLIMYMVILIILLLKKNVKMKNIMVNYNYMMLLFIFIVLTSFQKWYILWLIPTIMWQGKNMRRFIIYLTITAIIPSMWYFIVEGDPYILGTGYSLKILVMSIVLLGINMLFRKCIKIIRNKKVKQKNKEIKMLNGW